MSIPRSTADNEHQKFREGSDGSPAIAIVAPTGNLKVDEANGSITYVGLSNHAVATNAASWQIRKILVSGTVGATADANATFDVFGYLV